MLKKTENQYKNVHFHSPPRHPKKALKRPIPSPPNPSQVPSSSALLNPPQPLFKTETQK